MFILAYEKTSYIFLRNTIIKIRIFRNRIVHDYGNGDLDIVYETLKYDIPELLEQLDK
ncbi:MAG: HepT-like ribonuclease domain-containing protein [Butyrivibrio sp.]|nr:HepT-like ribonuclease domain-containing protein [Butyrivibrio hungatei]MEE3495097.1 HepT-like ribonuclease domain-containing protein [Butyrivibrio sp.]